MLLRALVYVLLPALGSVALVRFNLSIPGTFHPSTGDMNYNKPEIFLRNLEQRISDKTIKPWTPPIFKVYDRK
jgi:hypothetical protein